jgi:hypothetical protein
LVVANDRFVLLFKVWVCTMWEANGQPITIRAAIRWAIYYLTKCATTLVACRLYVDVGDPKVDVLEKVLGHGHGPCYDLKYFT